MNTIRLTSKLVALTIAGLGLVATGAQAGDGRHGHRYEHVPAAGYYGYADHHWHVYQRSRALIQRVNARQDRQMARIRAGKEAGSLTRFEFRELMREQRRIREMEHDFLADGLLDRREFSRLDRALDFASRNIRHEKHDHQARYRYDHGPWYN